MSARLDDLVPEIRDAAKELVRQCALAGLQPRVSSVLRSRAEQTRLYRRYLAGQAGYPVAPPGLSAHEYGLAFDMVVSPMDALADVGSVWIDWGGGWNPADAIHFEYPGASEIVKKAASGDEASQNWLVSVTDFLGSLPFPWYTAFIPTKPGEVTSIYTVTMFGDLYDYLTGKK
jgi:hypothetical protein